MSQFKQIVNKTLKPYIKPLAEVDHQNSVDLMLQCKSSDILYDKSKPFERFLNFYNKF